MSAADVAGNLDPIKRDSPPTAWLPDGRFAVALRGWLGPSWEVFHVTDSRQGEPGWELDTYLTEDELAAIPGVITAEQVSPVRLKRDPA